MQEVNKIDISNDLEWVRGSFNSSADFPTSPNRMTINYMPFTNGFTVSVKEGYRYSYASFDAITHAMDYTSGWLTGDVFVPGDSNVYRFIIGKPDQSLVTIEELEKHYNNCRFKR